MKYKIFKNRWRPIRSIDISVISEEEFMGTCNDELINLLKLSPVYEFKGSSSSANDLPSIIAPKLPLAFFSRNFPACIFPKEYKVLKNKPRSEEAGNNGVVKR